jgi:hypothetical protein
MKQWGRLFTAIIFACWLRLPAAAGGAVYFDAHVEGTNEALSGYLELAQEAGQNSIFRFRSRSGISCSGPVQQVTGVLHEAAIQCDDGRTGFIQVSLYGRHFVTDARLADRRLIMSMPNGESHRSR